MPQVFNLTNPQQVFQEIESPLKYQTKCIACFPDSAGYLLGSIEGRVAVQHVEESQVVSAYPLSEIGGKALFMQGRQWCFHLRPSSTATIAILPKQTAELILHTSVHKKDLLC